MNRHFEWLPGGIQHMWDRHKVKKETAERAMLSHGFDATITRPRRRTYRGVGTVDGEEYVVFFSLTEYEDPEKVYIHTCYRIRNKKER